MPVILDSVATVWNWIMSLLMEWLGFRIDTVSMIMSVPERKRNKVLKDINVLLQAKRVRFPVKHIASVVGQMISMKIVMGPVSQLMTSSEY